MAFSLASFVPLSAQANSDVPRQYMYSTSDAIGTVKGVSYFLDVYHVLAAGDIITVKVGSAEFYNLIVIASSSSSVTTQLVGVQAMTASGAVYPGVSSVELNHASATVAATIADASAHQGKLFVVKNTSTGGTESHTLALTSGTFDGTNNVATLDAPAECLAVWFDSQGNGTIIENVGTVALS